MNESSRAARFDVVVFEIADARFAVVCTAVREIVRASSITPIARSSPVVEGMIDIRGEVVPVISARRRLQLPPKEIEPADHFLVLTHDDLTVALLIDRPMEVASVEASDNAPRTPPVEGGSVIRLPGGLATLCDPAFLARGESLSATKDAAADAIRSERTAS